MFLHGCVYGVEHETVGLRVCVDGSDPTFDLDIGFHRVMAILVQAASRCSCMDVYTVSNMRRSASVYA